MLSTIKMEFDFDTNEPIVKITERKSPDMRDQMVTRFRQLFGHESNKCSVDFIDMRNDDGTGALNMIIRPIKPSNNA